jgi:hypothetical protein
MNKILNDFIRYEELSKEVRNLEGTLADYNLAFDKQRTNTRPEDIRNMYEYIKVITFTYNIQISSLKYILNLYYININRCKMTDLEPH